jgi:uncharacterized protein (TIGR02246 family)
MTQRKKWSASGLLLLGAVLGVTAGGAVRDAFQARGAGAEPAEPAKDSRAEDRAAIRKAFGEFIEAFAGGDAAGVASHWTAEGEYISEGTTLRGREAIRKAYAEFFGKHKKLNVDRETGSLRFTSKDTAIEEGYLKVRAGEEPPRESRYSVLYVREDGKWLLAVLRESPAEAASLRDLAWLVGTWEAKGETSEVRTTYEWLWDKAFLRATFTIKEKERTIQGMQLIGADPSTGQLRSWTFERTGGFGEALWTRDGTTWLLEAAGVFADGSTLAATNIFKRLDENTFTWQSTDRFLDGEPLPDLPPIKVKRVKGDK